jgi:hypothetical protein
VGALGATVSRGTAWCFAEDGALGPGVVDLWDPLARDMKTLAVLLMMPENRPFWSDPDLAGINIPSPSPPLPLPPNEKTRLMRDDFDGFGDGNCEFSVGSMLGIVIGVLMLSGTKLSLFPG